MRGHFRSALRLVVTFTIAFGALGAMPSIAGATEFQNREVGDFADAEWSSCGAAAAGQPCAGSMIQAWTTSEPIGDTNGKHQCIWVLQQQGNSSGNRYPNPSHETEAQGCDIGSTVVVASSLTKGKVRGDVDGRDCDVVSFTAVSCVPVTLSIALDWQSNGDVTRSQNVVLHESPIAPDQRCLEHRLPSGFSYATVSGQIAGLPAPLQPLTNAGMGFGGRMDVGTIPFCFD